MDFDGVPKGQIIPVYLTDDGNLHPIHFNSTEDLELVQELVAGILDYKIGVVTGTYLNNPNEKILIDYTKKKN